MKKLDYEGEEQVGKLQRQVFNYFWNEVNPVNGLVPVNSAPDSPAGIAATGMALTIYPVAVERRYMTRRIAAERTLRTLRFLQSSRSGPEPEASGHNGFYYSFLDLNKGRRARNSEINIADNSILVAGVLTAGMFFDNDSDVECEIRTLAAEIYFRVNWQWALDSGETLVRGWKPESGFSKQRSEGYDESMLAYILGSGSPTFPLGQESYMAWQSGYDWVNAYGHDYLYAGPLFIHQLPHIWIDFRGIADEYMLTREIDYFINSVRASHVHYEYAIDNPGHFEGYGKYFWGITISDGPGPCSVDDDCNGRDFYGYSRRGAPYGPDDGTASPWSAVSSLPFAPELVLPMIDSLMNEPDINMFNKYGFRGAYNPTYPHRKFNPFGWRSSWNYAMIQGPALALIENFRSGLLWSIMKNNEFIVNGLERTGFSGGWIERESLVEPDLETGNE